MTGMELDEPTAFQRYAELGGPKITYLVRVLEAEGYDVKYNVVSKWSRMFGWKAKVAPIKGEFEEAGGRAIAIAETLENKEAVAKITNATPQEVVQRCARSAVVLADMLERHAEAVRVTSVDEAVSLAGAIAGVSRATIELTKALREWRMEDIQASTSTKPAASGETPTAALMLIEDFKRARSRV